MISRSMKPRTHHDLIVWQKSVELAIKIYRLTECFASGERFGLVAQMRRAAVSISSNLAEGSKRGTQRDYRHFVLIAFGSGAELETQIEIARRLGLVSLDETKETADLLEEVMKMLNRLQSRLDKN